MSLKFNSKVRKKFFPQKLFLSFKNTLICLWIEILFNLLKIVILYQDSSKSTEIGQSFLFDESQLKYGFDSNNLIER